MYEHFLPPGLLPSGCQLVARRGWVTDGGTETPLSEGDLIALSVPPTDPRMTSNPPLGYGFGGHDTRFMQAPRTTVHIVLEQASSPSPSKTPKVIDVEEWSGDQTISYDGETLRIGGAEAKIPRESDATNRQLLLAMLVEDYNADASVGVSTIAFMNELRRMQLRSSPRAMESAVEGVRDEMERAFKLRGFVKMKRGTVTIPKKRE